MLPRRSRSGGGHQLTVRCQRFQRAAQDEHPVATIRRVRPQQPETHQRRHRRVGGLERHVEQLLRRALEGCDPAPSIVSTAEVSWQLGDITLLARALANIVENAKKYGRGVTAARLRRVQGHIHFEILDRGDGFTEDQVKVFEPFVRSPQAEVIDPTSMGLGLTLVKRVAEAHGGMAYCQNLPEGGACVGFSVEVLPVLQKGTPIPNSNTGNGPKTYNG